MADHGHYGGRPNQSRQGIYVCSPSGEFLASINSNDPVRVLETMRDGLAAWDKLPAESRQLSAESDIKPKHRWEDSYPADGLVLNIVTRDLPAQCDPNAPCEVKWNQDYAWFSKAEARQWLASDPQPGDVQELPSPLVQRLARLHFVDTVKGQSARFSADGVDGSEISTKVLSRKGAEVRLEISGETAGVTEAGWWRDSSNGVVTQLLGKATFDLDRGAFTRFELVALGRRWGATTYNGRRRDADTGPLGFVLRLAPRSTVPIAPAFVSSYRVDWIKGPNRR